MQETIKCPNCEKRIFDLEWQDRTIVKIKCIHCRNVVTVERVPPSKQENESV